ncbi:hypothetical protein [Streptomyces malaysiensis]|uniref:hypothetical protein n=1 Tax=Streptomyces malaysiensis TaxID=92644 RepID=UPI00352B5F2D
MLDCQGHFSTKSRRSSTALTALRQVRAEHPAEQATRRPRPGRPTCDHCGSEARRLSGARGGLEREPGLMGGRGGIECGAGAPERSPGWFGVALGCGGPARVDTP